MQIYCGYIGNNLNLIKDSWINNIQKWLTYDNQIVTNQNLNSNFFCINIDINIKQSLVKYSFINKNIDGNVFYENNTYNNQNIDIGNNFELIKEKLDKGICNGSYNFVYYENGSLIVYNDYYGFKPFFYYKNPVGELFFSNDIRLLILCDQVLFAPNINKCKITNTTYNICSENFDTETFFEGIKKLPNGVRFKYSNKKTTIKSIFNSKIYLKDKFIIFDDVNEYYKLFRTTLNKIIKRYVESYNSEYIGISLSGGIDSSVILASLIDLGYKDRLICYHASSKNPLYYSCNDSEIVKKIANDLGIKCKIFYQNDGNSICNAVLGRDYIRTINGPCCNGNDSFAYNVSVELAKDNVALFFGGDGGDYMFSGTRYCSDYFKQYKLKEAKKIHSKKMRESKKDTFLYKYIQSIPWLNEYYYKKIYWDEEDNKNIKYPAYFTKEMFKLNKKLNRQKNNYKESRKLKIWGRRYIYDFMFPKNSGDDEQFDGFTFIHPLLDMTIYELAQKIPPNIHYDITRGEIGTYAVQKTVLREAYKDILPDYITKQKHKTNYASSLILTLKKEQSNIIKAFTEFQTLYIAEYNLVDKELFISKLKKILLNINDPHFVPNLDTKYMCNLIFLEIWFKEINKGKNWLLQQCKILDRHENVVDLEVLNE